MQCLTGRAPNRLRRSHIRRSFAALAALGLVLLGVVATSPSASAGPVADAAGFAFSDGDLAVQPTFDWNGFAPTTWVGTSPSRTSSGHASGWAFTGLEDAAKSGTDSAFAGGTKQDADCASVTGASAPNKDDLRRVYVSSNTVGGHVYLALAWVRIPQNTTSPSAHIGFEFNQGSQACPAGSTGLVHRTAGDMLIVYDFEGGATDTPVITLRRWVTSGACEVGSDSAPCWGPSANLTAAGFAEAKVNTTAAVSDAIGPSGAQTLGINEFGEAGIDLTGAGVFTPDACTAFGKTYAVSRSSGNSATAQMKDLVGPGNINISNCGRVIIHKVTDPSPDPTGSTFNYTTTGGLSPAGFQLADGGTRDYGGTVHSGDYTVTESTPGPNFAFGGLDCTASDLSNGSTLSTSGATASFHLNADDTVECTYTNILKQGAILVTKTMKHAAAGPGDHPQSGVDFTVAGVTKTTDANGQACFDGLVFGAYDVTETLPSGYVADQPLTQSVTVDNTATCADQPYGGEQVSFHNTPLTNITLGVDSQVAGGTASTIDCNGVTGSTGAGGDGSLSVTDLRPGTYTCTVVVDP